MLFKDFCRQRTLLTLHSLTSSSLAAVIKHFADYSEDQFDFHAYCLRKVTLRSYVDVLRFEDRLHGEDYYFEAVEGTVGIYLHLYDNPDLIKEDEEPDYSNMTAAERKKAKNIARKKKQAAEKKKETEQKNKEDAQNGNKNKKGGKQANANEEEEEDPNGEELLKKDALEESQRYAGIVTMFAPKRFETWILQYDVAIRRKKALMALRALCKARAIDADRSEYFDRVIDFATKVDSFKDLPVAVSTILTEEFPRLLDNKSIADFLKSAAAKIREEGQRACLSNRTVVAKAMFSTKSGSAKDAAALILDGGISGKGVTVALCKDAVKVLRSFGEEAKASTEQWVTQVKERFPLVKDLN